MRKLIPSHYDPRNILTEKQRIASYNEVKNRFTQQKEWIVCSSGVRWCKCTECGLIKPNYEFSSYGGAQVNKGICKVCNRAKSAEACNTRRTKWAVDNENMGTKCKDELMKNLSFFVCIPDELYSFQSSKNVIWWVGKLKSGDWLFWKETKVYGGYRNVDVYKSHSFDRVRNCVAERMQYRKFMFEKNNKT